jgi:predicted ATPase/DNA-binding SARP family transcriptional activator/tetratricopeptide (TPR) repeat protein
MSDPLEIRILGPFDVLAGGRSLSVSATKRAGLLAILALRSGRPVAVDTLIDALWEADVPAAPRNAVQHHVARLRAALGHDRIVGTADGYALPEVTVDALCFEGLLSDTRAALREGDARAAAIAADSALALWRGPALEGLTDIASLAAEARRLEALRLDAVEERFDAALALGEDRELGSPLREALEEDPFRERLWGQLMLALYRCGRQVDALETFQEARGLLGERLALEPGPELRRLQEAILVHDPAIAPVPVAKRGGNVPAASTSFVDRRDELAQLSDLLREHRMVTLMGPPGVGKTRLALEAARALEDRMDDGVWLVELARSVGTADVPRLLAEALEARGADPLARAVARLREAEAVLLFDACEHVPEDAASVISVVLTECPHVHIVATSRVALHVDGEVRLTVEPLPLTDPGAAAGTGPPAVELFVARARAARPQFELTAETAPLIAEITRHVDGLPLAIELAAARVNVFGLTELLSLVERRLAVLHDLPEADAGRAALEALVEWSYDLLHADEKTLLQQLAVHRGGASLRSLVALAAPHGLDESTVAYLLGALVDKSIVSVSFASEDARYDVLDTIRQYALERLAQGGTLTAVREAHARYFASVADAAYDELRGPSWQSTTRRLALDNDNLWAALACARDGPDAWIAARLGSLGWYFALADRVSEGRRFVELALTVAAEDAPLDVRVELLAFLCYLATEALELDAAIEAGERGLALAATASPRPRGLVQATLALALDRSGDGRRAADLGEDARTTLEGVDDEWAMAAASLVRAFIAAHARDTTTVAAMVAETLRHTDAIGFDAYQPPALLLAAWLAEQRKDVEAAADAYARALQRAARAGLANHVAFALARLGVNALADGDARRAEELERRAIAAAEEARAPWVAALARVELGRVLTAVGDVETAERLYRTVLAWSETPRSRDARESLFTALVDDPSDAAAAALRALTTARREPTAVRAQA